MTKQVDIYVKDGCPFCVRAQMLLEKRNVNFNRIDVTGDADGFDKMVERAQGGRTVPQIFVGQTHIGGSDDLSMMARADFMALLTSEAA